MAIEEGVGEILKALQETKAIRTQRWKYIHYVELDGMDELYDLKSDPYEMKNLINSRDAAGTLADLKRDLEQFLK